MSQLFRALISSLSKVRLILTALFAFMGVLSLAGPAFDGTSLLFALLRAAAFFAAAAACRCWLRPPQDAAQRPLPLEAVRELRRVFGLDFALWVWRSAMERPLPVAWLLLLPSILVNAVLGAALGGWATTNFREHVCVGAYLLVFLVPLGLIWKGSLQAAQRLFPGHPGPAFVLLGLLQTAIFLAAAVPLFLLGGLILGGRGGAD